LTPLTFLNMFDRSSYSKNFMKYVKLYVYIKVYLTINKIIVKELIIT
jgi:translation initiation factor 2 beta subunit (eIF-2beta)/eIF-5